jgi:ABC-type transport system involved in Fe-S cluster assembly fused permease/ATPase subunit
MTKFGADFINNIREIPYANMAAAAEISIAHDVYDHVQR